MAEEQKPLSFIGDLSDSQAQNALIIANKAKAMHMNPRLAVAVAYREGRLNFGVDDGAAGEIGVMQVKPDTGKMLGFSEKDLRDPEKNIEAGLMYLNKGLIKYGDPKLAVAGYNAGMDHKFFEEGSNQKLPASTVKYVKEIQNWGGFTEPAASTTEPEASTTASTFKAPAPATEPASEEGFLMSKAKDLMFDANRWSEDQTPESLAKMAAPTVGAVAGTVVGSKAGQALDYLQAKTAAQKPATGGDLWRENWAGQGGERRGLSVPEASAGYQRSKGQGKVTGRVTKMFGPPTTTPEPGVFQPGRLAMPKPPNAPPITPLAGKVAQYGNAILNSPIGRKVVGGLGGYGAVQGGMDAYQRAQSGDNIGAAIAGVGAFGSGVAAVPTLPTRVIGGGLSMLSPAALWMLEHSRKMSPENAQGALQGTDQMGNPIP